MHLTRLGRVLVGLTGLALASSVLALPAGASTTSTMTDQEAASIIAEHVRTAGAARAALAADEDPFTVFEALADSVCQEPGATAPPNSSLVLANVAESPAGPAAVLLSADISADDDPSTLEKTCTFAAILSEDGVTIDGSYSMTVASPSPSGGQPLDQTRTVSGAVLPEFTTTTPVFTNISVYADASLTATGTTSRLIPAQRTVTDTVTTRKTAKQVKAAKKKYAKQVKAAKKAYKKAGTKKAKRAMTKKIATAKKAYKKAIAPSRRGVNRVESYQARTPYGINGTLDYRNDIRPE